MALAAEEYAALVDSIGSASTAAAAFRGVVDGLTTSAASSAAALGRSRDELGRFVKATSDAAAAADQLGAAQERIGSGTGRDALGRFTKGAGAATTGADNLTAAVNRTAGATQQAGARAGTAANGQAQLTDSMIEGAQASTQMGGATGKLQEVLGSLGPKGRAVAIVIGAIVTVATAAAATLWTLIAATVRLSQEKAALTEAFDALSDGAKSGVELMEAVDAIAARLPFAESKTQAWGKALLAVGKQGPELERSIVAVASATALMGAEGGRAAENLIKRFTLMADTGQKVTLDRRLLSGLAEAGVSAKALAEQLGVAPEKLGKMKLDADKLGEAFERAVIAKGAGSMQRMSLIWTSISAKIGDAWEDLFEDMGSAVDPLMTAVRDLFSEFFTGATLQKGTKSILVDVLSTILGWATRAIRSIHIGFLELQIGALKAYIMFAPLIAVLKMVLTNAEFLRGIKTILVIIAAALAVVIAGVGLMGAAMATMTGFAVTAFGVVQGAILWVIGAITGFVQAMIMGGTEGGNGFITGLIEGIRTGATAVANAVSDVAKNAEAAFTGFFEIRSPSRKMKRHGRQLPAGAAEGADEGAIQLEKSMDDIWRAPATRAGGGRRGGARGKLAETINFYFQGTREDFDAFRANIEKWLDQQEAAGPEPEPA